MKTLLLMTILLIIGFSGLDTWGADWKFFGGSFLSKGEEVLVYYDAGTVEYLSNGNIRAWTKAVKPSEVDRILGKQEVIKKAAMKLLLGYYPPYVLLNPYPKTSHDDYIEVIAWEEAAKHDEIKPRARILWELNCKEKMARTLSTTSYKDSGETESSSNPSKWSYTSPETNGETLHKILCKDRK